MSTLAKVISGGQTGVDRAALRAALACGLGPSGIRDGPSTGADPGKPAPGIENFHDYRTAS
jgi:hypothetical protein